MPVTRNDDVHDLMPRYQSRRIVHAAPIAHIAKTHLWVEIGAAQYAVSVPDNFFARYTPVAGDFYLVYDDGYTSVCPKASFEAGYTEVQ